MKTHAITHGEPVPQDDGRYHVKVYIYCAPCACQVATALIICQYRDKNDLVDFCIRLDYRQMTSCSASVSRIEGLIAVIHHLKETEKRDLHSGEYEAEQLKAFDREWLEREVYDCTEEDGLATLSPIAQLARIATLHEKEESCAAIILLGEADYHVPLMGVPPFRPFEPGRLPMETQMFRNFQKYHRQLGKWSWERDYMGTYSPKDPLPPRRPAPSGSDTTQTLESAQRGSKRPRSSTSD